MSILYINIISIIYESYLYGSRDPTQLHNRYLIITATIENKLSSHAIESINNKLAKVNTGEIDLS